MNGNGVTWVTIQPFIFQEENDLYSINLKPQLESRIKIFSKFEKDEASLIDLFNDYNSTNASKFVGFVDKYIMQAQEEISEAYNVCCLDPDKFLEECIDVIGYLLTLGSFIFPIFNLLNIKVETSKNRIAPLNVPSSNWAFIAGQVNSYLFSARRLWPERKWHYTKLEYSKDEYTYRVKQLFESIMDAVYLIFSFLLGNYLSFNIEECLINKEMKFLQWQDPK
jgi:hypothetical protein